MKQIIKEIRVLFVYVTAIIIIVVISLPALVLYYLSRYVEDPSDTWVGTRINNTLNGIGKFFGWLK